MGGIAAVAGALGPTLGGVLTSAISWRVVFLVNVPLAIVCVLLTRRAASDSRGESARMDLVGAVLLAVVLSGLVLGLTQTQSSDWGSPAVLIPLAASVLAGVALVLYERRTVDPLIDFALLRRNSNYAGATVSQGLAGMIEMGTAVIFPLMLILNMKMEPSLAGLALMPLTL